MPKTNLPVRAENDHNNDDIRESLCNMREVGPAKIIQISVAEVGVLHGLMIDLDLKHFSQPLLEQGKPATPESLFESVVKELLDRDGVFSQAEVRMSGGGLHVIIWFTKPVEFEDDTKRAKWRQIVKLVQRALPSDPHQPDIAGLTRPIGEWNSQAGRPVVQLRPGQPVSADAVEQLAHQLAGAPFESVSRLLFGSDRISPCPLCAADKSELVAGKHCGHCYHCGKKNLSQLFRVMLGSTTGAGEHARRLAKQFDRAAKELGWSGLPNTERRARIHGVTPRAEFTEPVEVVLENAAKVMQESEVVYRMGLDVYVEQSDADGGLRLEPLTQCGVLRPHAHLILATLFVCEMPHGDDNKLEFPPPREFAALLVRHAFSSLRDVRHYVGRPIFAIDYSYCDAGYEPNAGVLVHGPRILPKELGPTPNFEVDFPHLTEVLRDFPFRSRGDRANAIAALLTGYLAQHFVECGKPIAILDGNQPNVGKTLYANCISQILDGLTARMVRFTIHDEELNKGLGATLREPTPFTVVLFDNAKVAPKDVVSSPTIEALSTSPEIRIRILQTSSNLVLENNRLWLITMNNTRASADLMSRSLPIQLHFEGDPRRRSYEGRDPLRYSMQHRNEILSEIAGMVHRWIRGGLHRIPSCHRCAEWSSIIGGILHSNGIEGFLQNFDAVAAEFDAGLELLADMAQHLWSIHQHSTPNQPGGRQSSVFDFRAANSGVGPASRTRYGMTVSEISRLLDSWLRRQREKASCPLGESDRDLGRWMSSKLQREVTFLAGDRSVTCVFDRRQAQNQSYYWFRAITSLSTVAPSQD